MVLSTSCPDRTRWKDLLDGTLPAGEQAVLTGHLDTCEACQRTLDALAAGGKSWSAPAQRLAEESPASESALQRAMEELKGPGSEMVTQGATGGHVSADLDFLNPSDSPENLGRLSTYEVIEVLGRGGMGLVLKAFDPSLHRFVAIKVLAPHLATSATNRKRFSREARAAAAVSHEHVVAVHAVDEANGLPYMVMEYVRGISLQERIDRSGWLEVKEILRIGMQTAAGLAAAHTQGLIHRDIKPANILLENGVERVKITDFGLARAVDDASLTQTGVVAGTPQYMAPEQARAEPLDHRADLFSLGSVLYALCTGRAPFHGDTVSVLYRVREETPRPIHDINPDIPESLVAIIEKLHAKKPDNRFQSAAEVAQLLGQHLAHLQQPSLVPMPPKLERPATSDRVARRHAHRWAVAAALLLLFVGALSVSEATGVTKVTSTVIRVFTPQGTLVVEIDDPDVKVSIDADGREITVSGPGLHEVRVRPGEHRVQATKDGKPMPVDRPLVTISKGDRQVVKVSRVSSAGVATLDLNREFELVVRTGRGKLSAEERQRLIENNHPLLMQLIDPTTKRVIELFANLPDSLHKELLEKGFLKWRFAALDPERQKVYTDWVQLNTDLAKKQGGELPATMSLASLKKAEVGFAVVDIEEARQKVISGFILYPEHPFPVWVTVVGVQAAGTEPYFAAHRKQLSALRRQPDSPAPLAATPQAKQQGIQNIP